MSHPMTARTAAHVIAVSDEVARNAAVILEHVVRLRKSQSGQSPHPDAEIQNAVEFVLLTMHDSAVLLSDLVRHTGTLRSNLYARLLQLTVHESAKTLRTVLGRDFRARMVEVVGGDDSDAVLRTAHSAVTAIFRDSESQFGGLRDAVGAHRDREAQVRSGHIESVSEEDVAILAERLGLAMHPLLQIFHLYIESVFTEARPATT